MTTKTIKSAAALLLALAVCLGSFAGCAKKENGKTDGDKDTSEVVTDKNGNPQKGENASNGGSGEAQTDENGNTVSTPGSSSSSSSSNGNSSNSGGNSGGNGGNGGSNSGNGSGGTGSGSSSNSATGIGDMLPSDFEEKYNPNNAVIPDGITLSDAAIDIFDGAPNFNIKVKNDTGAEKSIDFSFMVFKPKNGKQFSQYLGPITVKANRTISCSFPLDPTLANLKTGDPVDIFYGNTLLSTVTVQ